MTKESTRQRIAWVGPCGLNSTFQSATLASALLAALSRLYDIECFLDESELSTEPGYPLPRYHYHRIHERSEAQPFDYYVYLLEDSVACQYVRLSAQVYPGLCILYDTVFNELFYGLYRYTTAPTELNNLTEDAFGEDAPKLGDFHVRGWSHEVFSRRYAFGAKDLQAFSHVAVFHKKQRAHVQAVNPASTCTLLSMPLQPGKPVELQSERREETWKLLYCGEHFLIDRVFSFLHGVHHLRTLGFASEVRWHVSTAHAKQMAADAVAAFLESLNVAGHTCSEAELNIRLSAESESRLDADYFNSAFVYLNLRSDSRRGWPRGMDRALLGARALIVTEAQWFSLQSTERCFVIPQGRGDEKYLSILLAELHQGILLKASRSPQVGSTWLESASMVAEQIHAFLSAHQDSLHQAFRSRQDAIEKAQGVLLKNNGDAMLAAFGASLQEKTWQSLGLEEHPKP